MKKLYVYRVSELEKGVARFNQALHIESTAQELVLRGCVSIGQRPDYSEYLVLSEETNTLSIFKEFDGNYLGWDFNYCQEWGLTINDEVIERVKKVLRLKELDSITIEENGKVFDGNEKARLNMLSVIQSAGILGVSSKKWKLANNTWAEVTLEELKNVLALSINKVGEILEGQ
jgi:hypothetical protein